jgi:hypothetical protein
MVNYYTVYTIVLNWYYQFLLVQISLNQFELKSSSNQFGLVVCSFLRFQSGFLSFTILGNRLRLRLHPKKEKNRTGPDF